MPLRCILPHPTLPIPWSEICDQWGGPAARYYPVPTPDHPALFEPGVLRPDCVNIGYAIQQMQEEQRQIFAEYVAQTQCMPLVQGFSDTGACITPAGEIPLTQCAAGVLHVFAVIYLMLQTTGRIIIEQFGNPVHPTVAGSVTTTAQALAGHGQHDRDILITTHSPQIVRWMAPIHVYVVVRTTQCVVLRNILKLRGITDEHRQAIAAGRLTPAHIWDMGLCTPYA